MKTLKAERLGESNDLKAVIMLTWITVKGWGFNDLNVYIPKQNFIKPWYIPNTKADKRQGFNDLPG